jgi:uncharacterized protein
MRHLAQSVALQTLRAYKWAVSPMFPAACRYTPTCSEYAMEAIERHGVLRGGLKAAARLLRCHPFVKGGYDPVVKPDGGAAWKSGPLRPALSAAEGAASEIGNSPGFSPGGRS